MVKRYCQTFDQELSIIKVKPNSFEKAEKIEGLDGLTALRELYLDWNQFKEITLSIMN